MYRETVSQKVIVFRVLCSPLSPVVLCNKRLETSVGLVPVYRTRVKTRIVNLPRGEDESEMVNAYFVMNFISYGTVNNLRRNPLRIE